MYNFIIFVTMALKSVKTVRQLILDSNVKKKYIAEVLNISRPTLDKKIKDNSFTEEEKRKLKENRIIPY